MNFLVGFLNVVWKIWFFLITVLYVVVVGVFLVIPLALTDKTFPIAYKFIQFWGTYTFYGMGFRKKLIEKVKLDPNQTYIFIANHTSPMDIMLMLNVLKNHPIVFVGKAELLKIPIFRHIYKRVAIPVDRSNLRSRAQVYPLAKSKLNHGLNIFIFPEGGVPDDTTLVLDQFKDGAFAIAQETQTPIAVFTIKGLKEMFPFDYFKGYPGKVEVTLLEIVDSSHYTKQDLKAYCRKIILENLQNT
ncbi:lysophospholipid acyltransferase family protein [Vaginella massiliensis]|uniref:lysophospholipid acyltransferase family protein n=1 Tax=Vaginella massiliensis TaxID=1816680 RepID=UPI0008398032|nr:lysophospholipid acyltransferase family protein [Vaginella massiliensis]